jgi:catechol 2,3-dioxygenase-like lactoylglutathione lyase family enzyme
MKRILHSICLLAIGFLIASVRTNHERVEPSLGMTMNTPSVSLGYVILFVQDVSASLTFYEQAFGLSRRFFNDDNGKAYGELETGAACLAFANIELARAQLEQETVFASPDKPPLGVEVALITVDVPELYARALEAGAPSVRPPATMPWGQTIAYVRDIDGHLIELCTRVAPQSAAP